MFQPLQDIMNGYAYRVHPGKVSGDHPRQEPLSAADLAGDSPPKELRQVRQSRCCNQNLRGLPTFRGCKELIREKTPEYLLNEDSRLVIRTGTTYPFRQGIQFGRALTDGGNLFLQPFP